MSDDPEFHWQRALDWLNERQAKLTAWHKELRSWQDRWNAYSGHPMGGPVDPERDESMRGREDHRDDVAAVVRDSISQLEGARS